MKSVKVICDGCGTGLNGALSSYYSLSYGRHGCVTRSADLCEACKNKMEAAVSIQWDKLDEATQQ